MLPQPTALNDRCRRFLLVFAAALLAALGPNANALAEAPLIVEDRLFQPVEYGHFDGNEGMPLGGQPYQDFTVQPPLRTFPNCRLPLLSWRLGPAPENCGQYGPNIAPEVPAHAVRKAIWYGSADLVMLNRDPYQKQTFARVGAFGVGATALSTSDLQYPLDAGGQFMIGRKFTEQLSFEASYLGSFEWQADTAVRNALPNTLLGGSTTGVLASPFTQFGLLGQTAGLDFNNLVAVNAFNRLESLDLMFRYRPASMPYGAYDVSFLYGFRYLRTGEQLQYHSESSEPVPGGSTNDVNVTTDNDLIGVQVGLTNHFLVLPSFWFDWDIKGGIYNNHARQQTVYQNVTGAGALTAFNNTGRKDDTAYTLDIRLIGNYQLLPRLTLRGGYQATFLESVATGVSNFPTDLDIVRFGPPSIDTRDNVIYHGPVIGVMWER